MQEQPADPRDRELMDALATLKLLPPGTSQRDIWYRAGVQVGRRHAKPWKALAAIVTLAAGIGLTLDHRPPPTHRAAYVQQVEPVPTSNARLQTTSSASLAYERLRDRLVEGGLRGLPPIDFTGDGGQPPAGEAEKLKGREDVSQSLWYQEYKAASDELWRAWTLPYWEAEQQMMQSWRAMNADQPPLAQNPLVDAYLVSQRPGVPMVLQIRYNLARSDQYLALMRTIEALRDYAAAHEGHPPQNLDQITLPLPVDPLTGKPFEYHTQGQTATLDAPSPAWRGPGSGWHYDLLFAQ